MTTTVLVLSCACGVLLLAALGALVLVGSVFRQNRELTDCLEQANDCLDQANRTNASLYRPALAWRDLSRAADGAARRWEAKARASERFFGEVPERGE